MARSRSRRKPRRAASAVGAPAEQAGKRRRVQHRSRGEMPRRYPLHVTSRFEKGLPNARRKDLFRVIRGALRDKCVREGFRLVQFSVQSNHIHMVVEAEDAGHLARGMQSVLITIAKRLNSWWGRKGRVIEHRYHARQLRTPTEVRNALAYVLCNARRHGVAVSTSSPDDRSSGPWFDGWKERVAEIAQRDSPVARARTWLLSRGWRRAGLIPIAYVPRAG